MLIRSRIKVNSELHRFLVETPVRGSVPPMWKRGLVSQSITNSEEVDPFRGARVPENVTVTVLRRGKVGMDQPPPVPAESPILTSPIKGLLPRSATDGEAILVYGLMRAVHRARREEAEAGIRETEGELKQEELRQQRLRTQIMEDIAEEFMS
jgi:hypothetical protein